jgi:tRNA 2-thiouridine synthesizing protein A
MVRTLDVRGLRCPLPLIRARAALPDLAPGDVLEVLATDPEAPIDLGAWAAREGHALEERRLEGWTEFRLVKGAATGGGPP